jgi:hypothetical protein
MSEPPIAGATFNISNPNGHVSNQVFKKSHLYHHIATTGVGGSLRNVRHPPTRARICFDNTLRFSKRAYCELQERINKEQ